MRTVLSISGMNCASCVAHVQSAINKTPGVADCRVNLASARAVIDHDAPIDLAQLTQAVESAGYGVRPVSNSLASESERTHHHHHAAQSWLFRAVLGLALWAPVEFSHWFFHGAVGHQTLIYWSLIASTLAILFVGGGFYRGAWSALKHGSTNMDCLIAMGASVAWVYSLVAFLGYKFHLWNTLPDLYFMESAGLLALISLGHWLESRARHKAGSAIENLMSLCPQTTLRENEAGEFVQTPVSSIEHGDKILVRPGDHIPVDGVILDGKSDVDESMLTGESIPVLREKGNEVVAGALNTTGRLIIQARKVGAETALSKIIELVETAQSSKPPIQKLADQISAVFVPSVFTIALLTGVCWTLWGMSHNWPASQTAGHAAKAVCSVLIIACPCALGLAVPAALMVGIGAGAKRGILIRDIDALQKAERITAVAIDKTGTLTAGKPAVVNIQPADGVTLEHLLSRAASAEQYSEHPLAKAIVDHARRQNIPIEDPSGFENLPGQGVSAQFDTTRVLAGNQKLLTDNSVNLIPVSADASVVYVAENGRFLGHIELTDPIREDSPSAVQRLNAMGLKTLLITGDSHAAASRVASSVGILTVHAQVSPADKAAIVAEIQKSSPVAMVGDGVNDAPALAQATLGVAIGAGSDIAKETGDIILSSPSLHGVADAIELSKWTMRKIRQNLALAFLYNVLAIPLAAFGLLNPMIAAGAMALSDVSVIGNALLPNRKFKKAWRPSYLKSTDK